MEEKRYPIFEEEEGVGLVTLIKTNQVTFKDNFVNISENASFQSSEPPKNFTRLILSIESSHSMK